MLRPGIPGVTIVTLLTALFAVSACQTTKKKSSELEKACKKQTVEECREKNRQEVKAMIADPDNEWVFDFSDNALVSGKRLAAFIGSAPQLTCPQILVGIIEADRGLLLLSRRDYQGPPGAQVSLLIVSKHAKNVLEKEQGKRCDGAKPKS